MPRPLDARRPVALFANGIGDHLLNLPALRALSALYPGRLRLVCMPGARATFFGDLPLLDALEIEFVREGSRREFDADALAARIGRCDLFLSLVPWHSDSMDRLLRLVAPTHCKGFYPAFHDRLPLDYCRHGAELAFDLP